MLKQFEKKKRLNAFLFLSVGYQINSPIIFLVKEWFILAKVFSTESSQYTQAVIDSFTKNRIGQFSKYLDSDPYFVTYYHINDTLSRADIGTDQVYEQLGPKSPLRFNKIKKFPVYLKTNFIPEANFENGGMDVELEISDVTTLPNTIQPKPGDFILFEIPRSPKLLFIVNNFRFSTIQSNEFYTSDISLRHAGDNCDIIEKQVVETYTCVFENIGTQNNCFIKSDDESALNTLDTELASLESFYRDAYYDNHVGTYIFNPLRAESVDWVQPSANVSTQLFYPEIYSYSTSYLLRQKPREHQISPPTFYDIYLIKFLRESEVFFDSKDPLKASNLSYDDFEPDNFDWLFRRSLWYTIITKDTKYLCRYPYYIGHEITKMMSPLRAVIHNSHGLALVMHLENECDNLEKYMSHVLIKMILDYNANKNDENTTHRHPSIMDADIVNISPIPLNGKERRTNPISPEDYNINIPEDTESSKYDIEGFDNTLTFIYNYVTGDTKEVDESEMIRELIKPSQLSYWYTPMVIYIMQNKYSSYFTAIS